MTRRCELCGRELLKDEWEIFDRALCVFCTEELWEEEKEEGEEDGN